MSDHSVVEKQRDQLQDLSERREQLEMMISWKEGMCDLRTMTVDRLADLWAKLIPGYGLNETGRQGLKKLAGRYALDELMEAMRIALDQYIEVKDGKPTQESVEIAWKKVTGICRMRELEKTKPYIRDLFYTRGILRKRVYVNEFYVMELLESAHLAGVSVHSLKAAAKTCRNWTDFQAELHQAIENA